MRYDEWCEYHDIVPSQQSQEQYAKIRTWFTQKIPEYLHCFYKLPPYSMEFTDTKATAKVKFNNKTTTGFTVEILEDDEVS